MRNFLILDAQHLFHRAKYVITANNNDDQIGLILHTVFTMINKIWNKFHADHLVIALEGHSWRYDIYPKYKSARKEKLNDKTPKEIELDEKIYEMFEDFSSFLEESTHCTVLRHSNAEADDMIARFTAIHPNDTHIIISSDMDFVQLLSDNVVIYDGLKDVIITNKGVYDDKERLIEFDLKNDGKIKLGKQILKEVQLPYKNWVKYALFCKCIRGDSSDSIFSAYPGVRQKGTKNKVGLNQAFDDMEKQGYDWNNFMNQTWEDHEGNIHTVKEKYEFNKTLIDMDLIPEEYKKSFDEYIMKQCNTDHNIKMMGIKFLQFIKPYDLREVEQNQQNYIDIFKKEYPNE